jgi:epoxyqueuosine reductase QueG
MEKQRIVAAIRTFVQRYQTDMSPATRWGIPIVAFASAGDPLFSNLKEVVTASHLLPGDLLPGAKTVIAFFLPFAKPTAAGNIKGKLASREWGVAYVETNALIGAICQHMTDFLEQHGFKAAITPATHNFDPKKLISDWSHRHVGYIAGLGTFGLNNMIITRSGCCGRVGSFVSDIELPGDQRPEREACLYRYDSSCLQCVERCVNAALFRDHFDRWRCYDMCQQNEANLREIGMADVCGKCLVGLPCSFTDPVSKRASSQQSSDPDSL